MGDQLIFIHVPMGYDCPSLKDKSTLHKVPWKCRWAINFKGDTTMKMHIEMNAIESKAFVSLMNKFGANVSANDLKTHENISRCGIAALVVNEDKSFKVKADFNTDFTIELMKIGEEATDLILGFYRSIKFFAKDIKSRMAKWDTPIYERLIRDKFEEMHNDVYCIVAIEDDKDSYVLEEINPGKPVEGLKLIAENKGKPMHFAINADGAGSIEYVDAATIISKLI